MVWAYARLGVPREKAAVEALMQRVMERVLSPEILRSLVAPQVANVLWGYAALGIHNVTLLDRAAPVYTMAPLPQSAFAIQHGDPPLTRSGAL